MYKFGLNRKSFEYQEFEAAEMCKAGVTCHDLSAYSVKIKRMRQYRRTA